MITLSSGRTADILAREFSSLSTAIAYAERIATRCAANGHVSMAADYWGAAEDLRARRLDRAIRRRAA